MFGDGVWSSSFSWSAFDLTKDQLKLELQTTTPNTVSKCCLQALSLHDHNFDEDCRQSHLMFKQHFVTFTSANQFMLSLFDQHFSRTWPVQEVR